MGNRQDKVVGETPTPTFDTRLTATYEALCDNTTPVAGLHASAFQKLFSSHPDIGAAVFQYMIKLEANEEQILLRHAFLTHGQEVLQLGSPSLQLKLYVAILSGCRDNLSKTDVQTLLEAVFTFEWSRLGGWCPAAPSPSSFQPLLQTLLGPHDELQSSVLCSRLAQHLPAIFNSLHNHVQGALCGSARHNNAQSQAVAAAAEPQVLQDSSILSPWMLWGLSFCLGNTYIPLSGTGGSGTASSSLGRLVDAGAWHCLYNSDKDGLSPNRFTHHVLSYQGPSLLLLTFAGHCFSVAVDEEWRDSTVSWGGSQCQIIQLQPQWRQVASGASLLYLNLGARNAPKYLAVGRNPALFIVDCNFEKVKLHGVEYKLEALEVWGCGGEAVLGAQKEQKQWEHQEADKAKNRKLKLEDWKNNPDRQLLTIGGVTTEHAEK